MTSSDAETDFKLIIIIIIIIPHGNDKQMSENSCPTWLQQKERDFVYVSAASTG